ncbi:MAG TPA: sulfatase [Thermoleophilaceae bacterium]|nr:sulfatase [Thermoleophilaceae bacterium]
MRKLPFTLACALCAVLLAAPSAGGPTSAAAQADPRPNVVVLMTDDQTLRSMRAMPRTRWLIGDQGARFANSFVSNPRCCPSRATFLTGQYSHNNGVFTNGPPIGGWQQLRGTSNWLPTWLQATGYRTVHTGKFLNHYGLDDPTEVPPGWDEWYGTIDPTTYRYSGYTVNENGSLRTYGRDRDPRWYSTDFAGRRAVGIVERLAPAAQPFFLSVAFLAPHTGGPHEPGDPVGLGTPAIAARHRGAFGHLALPRGGAFDEVDVSDKPPFLRRPRLRPRTIAGIEALYRQRLESLIAVDEAVEQIVAALQRSGELDKTLIVFTSDNGYLAGEHRLPHGKAKAYDPSIRVPLMIRGPGVPAGVRPQQMVVNADLAPTILDAARATAGRVLDGRSLLPLTRDPALGANRPVLVEIAKGAGMLTTAIRTRSWMYAEHVNGASELYDMARDPHQLRSLHASPRLAAVRAALARRLARLRSCRGSACWRPFAESARRTHRHPRRPF